MSDEENEVDPMLLAGSAGSQLKFMTGADQVIVILYKKDNDPIIAVIGDRDPKESLEQTKKVLALATKEINQTDPLTIVGLGIPRREPDA